MKCDQPQKKSLKKPDKTSKFLFADRTTLNSVAQQKSGEWGELLNIYGHKKQLYFSYAILPEIRGKFSFDFSMLIFSG